MTVKPDLPIVPFASKEAWEAWLEEEHATSDGVWLKIAKKGSGIQSVTFPEALDGALCYGWIDGVRRSLGDEAYTIRFTPRKPRSTWSAVNIKRMGELIAEGRVHPAGLAAFQAREESNSRIYAYENRDRAVFDPAMEERFRANEAAWNFFQAQPQGYRTTCTHWVTSAKQEATRLRRLEQLIADSAAGRRIAQLARPGPKEPRGE